MQGDPGYLPSGLGVGQGLLSMGSAWRCKRTKLLPNALKITCSLSTWTGLHSLALIDLFPGAFSSVGFTFLTLFVVLLPEVRFLSLIPDPHKNNCPKQRKDN